MKVFRFGIFLFLLLSISQTTYATDTRVDSSQPFALVELFTSEGCSSCPPAEKFLKILSEEAKKQKKQMHVFSQ